MQKFVSVLNAANPAEAIVTNLASSNRFAFIDTLRIAAVRSLAETLAGASDATLRVDLAEAESRAIQRQFERLDEVVVGTLTKDGSISEYENYAPEIDRDLPEDPNSLRDPIIAYRYAMARLYRRQFDVTMEHKRKDGCWPLICYDLLDPIDGKRNLIVNSARQSVDNHASTEFLKNLDLPSLRQMRSVFATVRSDAARRLAALGQEPTEDFRTAIWGKLAQALIKAIEAAGVIEGAIALYERMREAYEKAQREREEAERERQRQEAERREREAAERWRRELQERSIPDGSGHMDLYEKNKERIGGLC